MMDPRRLRLLPLLCLLLPLLPACSRTKTSQEELRAVRSAMEKDSGATAMEKDSGATLVTGERALELLDARRRELFYKLQEESDVPLKLVVDARTRTVLSISLHVKTRGETPYDRSMGFFGVYQELIDPFVASSEYVLADTDPSCYDGTTAFDRVLDDLPVLGSRITLHFDESHALESVTNGVASVMREVVEVDQQSIEGAQPLEALLPGGYEGAPARTKVFVPSPDLRGVFEAELVTWAEPAKNPNGSNPVAAVVVKNIAITGKLKVATTVSYPPFTVYEPKYLDKDGLPLPEFISYRDIGGVQVSHFPWEQNPVEMAYRFLEEHPALMRTFAARCQYAPAGLDEDAAAPGVYFVRLRQKYGPLPVFGSELVVMQEGLGKVVSIAGRSLDHIEAATTPAITIADALDAAAETLEQGAKQDPAYEDSVRDALSRPSKIALGVLPAHKQDPSFGKEERLVYEVQRGPYIFYVDALTKDAIGSRTLVMPANIVTDAGGGNELGWPFIIDEIDGIPTGLISPRNADNLPTRPGGNTGMSLGAVSGFYASAGWNGPKNLGGDWVANTNVNMIFTPCQNAFFDGFLTGQTFYCIGAAANDVVGHELTHGVVAASSGLWFSDQSGAMNEAYADVMGNLASPDATPGNWQIGELTNSGAGPAWRDMKNPGIGHMSQFTYRTPAAGCNLLPWSCDSGFVHANAGIINRAHVMLADGIFDAMGNQLTPGIGRDKMKRLIFFTMTRRLPSDARMNDAPVATRDICEMFLSRGVADEKGNLFTLSDCDQVTQAFNQVGLNGQLDTGWQEPTLGLVGSHTFYDHFEMTPGNCPVANVIGDLNTLSGSSSIDLDPTSALPTSTSDFFGTQGISLRLTGGGLPLPLGTTSMLHTIDWRSIFGREPKYATTVVSPATCAPPVNQVERLAPGTFVHNNAFGATGFTSIGNSFSTMPPASCILRDANLELLDAFGNVSAGPSHAVLNRVSHCVFGLCVNYDQRAQILIQPTGINGNLAAFVQWNYDIGRGPIQVRLRYTIDQIGGATCIP
jgi:Zn-dependent metalloprotease